MSFGLDFGYTEFKSVICGTVAKDPEMTFTQNGSQMVKLSVRTTSYLWDSGAKKNVSVSCWHNFTIFSSDQEQSRAKEKNYKTMCERVNEGLHAGDVVYMEYVPDMTLEYKEKGSSVGGCWEYSKTKDEAKMGSLFFL